MDDVRLRVETEDVNGIPLIRAHGEIDLYTVRQLREAIRHETERRPRALIIDLSATQYLDSSGLSELIAAYRMLTDFGSDLFVVAPADHPAVRRVLEITRLNLVFPVCSSVDEVMSRLRIAKAA
jgi:anti-sigma B factor antagonist